MKINEKNNNEVSVEDSNNSSISVNISNNEILMAIVGSLDSNLKELEKISGSKIFFRGNSIIIRGQRDTNERVKCNTLFSRSL